MMMMMLMMMMMIIIYTIYTAPFLKASKSALHVINFKKQNKAKKLQVHSHKNKCSMKRFLKIKRYVLSLFLNTSTEGLDLL